MQRLPNVHPSDTVKWPTGIGTFDVGAANEGSKILLYNGTQLTLQLDFLNGYTDTLHPWEANYWVLDGDTKQIQWTIDTDSLNVSTPPINAVFLTLYSTNEKVSGTYPVSLFYQTSLGGGTTSTNVGTVSSIVNDNNPSGTTLIESKVSGQTGNTILTNDGLLNIVTLISGLMTQLIKTQNTGNPLLLGVLGKITEILGNLTIDGNTINTGTLSTGTVTFNNGASVAGGDITLNGLHNILGVLNIVSSSVQTATMNEAGNANSWASVTNGGPTRIQSTGAGAQVAIQVPGGTTVMGFVAGQAQLASTATFRLANGNQISGISSFTGAAIGTFNHTYGSAPFFVLPVCNVVGSETVGYDTVTSTQVHITIGAALAFKVMCFG